MSDNEQQKTVTQGTDFQQPAIAEAARLRRCSTVLPCFVSVPFNYESTPYSGNETDTLQFAQIKAKLAQRKFEEDQKARRGAVRLMALREIARGR